MTFSSGSTTARRRTRVAESPSLIITDLTCRFCLKPLSVNNPKWVTQADRTVIHEECLMAELELMDALERRLAETPRVDLEYWGGPVPGGVRPCDKCQKSYNELAICFVDGGAALYCRECELDYYRTHPEQLSPANQKALGVI